MKIKWLRIYKRYLNMSKVGALSAYNEMMHDYWNGAIPGVPRGRYGEVPHGASYGQLVAELKANDTLRRRLNRMGITHTAEGQEI